jgi:hypothetical protein
MQKWAKPAEAERVTRRRIAKEDADVAMATPVPGSSGTRMAAAQLVRSIAQLTLQNSRELRAHAAALQHVILLPADHAVSIAMQNKGMEYYEQRKTQSAQMAGAPHHHVWAAMVLSLVAAGKTASLSSTCREDLANIERHANSTESPIELQDSVHVCKITKSHQEGTSKIFLSVAAELHPIMVSIIRLLAALGGTITHGAAPKGPLERKIENALRTAAM